MIPAINGDDGNSSGANAKGAAFFGWALVMIFSAVPSALSNAVSNQSDILHARFIFPKDGNP